MNIAETYAALMSHPSSDVRFVANVIWGWHKNPVVCVRMKGLLVLVDDGYAVRVDQFDPSKLIIGGKVFGWEVLEVPSLVQEWHSHASDV